MRFAILCHDKEDEQFAFKISMCEMTNSFMFIFSQLSIYCKITMEIGTFPFKYYVHNFTFYALSSLAYSDAEKANLFAKRLSGVYRYILDTRETDKVTTDVEMAFVRSYIYLESVSATRCRCLSRTLRQGLSAMSSRQASRCWWRTPSSTTSTPGHPR